MKPVTTVLVLAAITLAALLAEGCKYFTLIK
jgi:hypothetical protein